MKKEGLYKIILIFALIGFLVSSYLTYNHYYKESTFCLPGQEKSCNIVLQGPYATLFFGIPNSLIGMFGFSLIFFLALQGKKGNKKVPKLIFWFSLAAALFVIYLVYLVFFIIQAFCQWCFVAWVCIYAIFISSIVLFRKSN